MDERFALFQGEENYLTIIAAMRAMGESMKRDDLQDISQAENIADVLADGEILLDVVQHIADMSSQPSTRKRSLRSTPSKGKSLSRFDLCVSRCTSLSSAPS